MNTSSAKINIPYISLKTESATEFTEREIYYENKAEKLGSDPEHYAAKLFNKKNCFLRSSQLDFYDQSDEYHFLFDVNLNKKCVYYDRTNKQYLTIKCSNTKINDNYDSNIVVFSYYFSNGATTAIFGIINVSENKLFQCSELLLKVSDYAPIEYFINCWKNDKLKYSDNITDIYLYGELFNKAGKYLGDYVVVKKYNTFENLTIKKNKDCLNNLSKRKTLEFYKMKLKLLESLLELCVLIHRNGNFLRDLKLENMGYDENFNAVIIDYDCVTILPIKTTNDIDNLFDLVPDVNIQWYSGTYVPYTALTQSNTISVISKTNSDELKFKQASLLYFSATIGLVQIIGSLFAQTIAAYNNFLLFMFNFGYDTYEDNNGIVFKANNNYEKYVTSEIRKINFDDKIEQLILMLLMPTHRDMYNVALDYVKLISSNLTKANRE